MALCSVVKMAKAEKIDLAMTRGYFDCDLYCSKGTPARSWSIHSRTRQNGSWTLFRFVLSSFPITSKSFQNSGEDAIEEG